VQCLGDACPRGLGLEKRENHANAVGFGFDLFETGAAVKIVKSDVTMAMVPSLQPHPIQVLSELSRTNSREADPQEAFFQWKQTAAPAQGFDVRAANFVQIDDALDLERSRIHNYDMRVDGGEIERAVEEEAVVRTIMPMVRMLPGRDACRAV